MGVIWKLAAIAATTTLAAGAPPPPAAPLPTPDLYVTQNYGLDLRVPPGLVYCPGPAEGTVVMGDHGRIFLMADAPVACADDKPSLPIPSISLYYRYAPDEEEMPEAFACGGEYVGRAVFAGEKVRLCRETFGTSRVVLSLTRLYSFGPSSGLVSLTLTTTGERLERDRALFLAMAANLSACRPDWAKRGEEPPCPAGRWW